MVGKEELGKTGGWRAEGCSSWCLLAGQNVFLIMYSTPFHSLTPTLPSPGASDVEGTGHSDSEGLMGHLAGWSGVCSPLGAPKGTPGSLLHLLFPFTPPPP